MTHRPGLGAPAGGNLSGQVWSEQRSGLTAGDGTTRARPAFCSQGRRARGRPSVGSVAERRSTGLGTGFPFACALVGGHTQCFWASGSSSAQSSVSNPPGSFPARFGVRAARWERLSGGYKEPGVKLISITDSLTTDTIPLLGRLPVSSRWTTQDGLRKAAVLHGPARRAAPIPPAPAVPWRQARLPAWSQRSVSSSTKPGAVPPPAYPRTHTPPRPALGRVRTTWITG